MVKNPPARAGDAGGLSFVERLSGLIENVLDSWKKY